MSANHPAFVPEAASVTVTIRFPDGNERVIEIGDEYAINITEQTGVEPVEVPSEDGWSREFVPGRRWADIRIMAKTRQNVESFCSAE